MGNSKSAWLIGTITCAGGLVLVGIAMMTHWVPLIPCSAEHAEPGHAECSVRFEAALGIFTIALTVATLLLGVATFLVAARTQDLVKSSKALEEGQASMLGVQQQLVAATNSMVALEDQARRPILEIQNATTHGAPPSRIHFDVVNRGLHVTDVKRVLVAGYFDNLHETPTVNGLVRAGPEDQPLNHTVKPGERAHFIATFPATNRAWHGWILRVEPVMGEPAAAVLRPSIGRAGFEYHRLPPLAPGWPPVVYPGEGHEV